MVTSFNNLKKKRKQLHAEYSELRSEHGLGPKARRARSNPVVKHLCNWDQELALGQNQSAKLWSTESLSHQLMEAVMRTCGADASRHHGVEQTPKQGALARWVAACTQAQDTSACLDWGGGHDAMHPKQQRVFFTQNSQTQSYLSYSPLI